MNTIETKCAVLAQTPQSRWFDLRFKAFVSMVNGLDTPCFEISNLFPFASVINMVGYCFKHEEKYYFLLAVKNGIVYECFNVESLYFDSNLSNTIRTNIILSSDDDSDRLRFLPILISRCNYNHDTLRNKLEFLFANGIKRNGALRL